MRLALGASVALNVVLYVRLVALRWHVEQEVRSAHITGRREGWFAALRHLPVGRDAHGGNPLN